MKTKAAMNKERLLERWLLSYNRADCAVFRFFLVPSFALLAFRYTPEHNRWYVNVLIIIYLLTMAGKLFWLIKEKHNKDFQ